MVRQRQTTNCQDRWNALKTPLATTSITIRQLTETEAGITADLSTCTIDKYDMFEQMKWHKRCKNWIASVVKEVLSRQTFSMCWPLLKRITIYMHCHNPVARTLVIGKKFLPFHAWRYSPRKEHIISDFFVPYKYGLEIFIATIESVLLPVRIGCERPHWNWKSFSHTRG